MPLGTLSHLDINFINSSTASSLIFAKVAVDFSLNGDYYKKMSMRDLEPIAGKGQLTCLESPIAKVLYLQL